MATQFISVIFESLNECLVSICEGIRFVMYRTYAVITAVLTCCIYCNTHARAHTHTHTRAHTRAHTHTHTQATVEELEKKLAEAHEKLIDQEGDPTDHPQSQQVREKGGKDRDAASDGVLDEAPNKPLRSPLLLTGSKLGGTLEFSTN